jgi:hypothetical protein
VRGAGPRGVGALEFRPSGARHAYRGQADGCHRQIPAALRALAEFGFQHCGTPQATGDAGEDDRKVGGAERSGEEGEAWGAGPLLDRDGELLAVIDQLADQVEDAAEAAGHVRAGPRWIGLGGWGGKLEGGGHERNKNTKQRRCQGIISGGGGGATKQAFSADAGRCTPNTQMFRYDIELQAAPRHGRHPRALADPVSTLRCQYDDASLIEPIPTLPACAWKCQ